MGSQPIHLEAAESEVQLCGGRRATHLVKMDKSLTPFGGLRPEGDMWQGRHDFGGQVQRVDQRILA